MSRKSVVLNKLPLIWGRNSHCSNHMHWLLQIGRLDQNWWLWPILWQSRSCFCSSVLSSPCSIQLAKVSHSTKWVVWHVVILLLFLSVKQAVIPKPDFNVTHRLQRNHLTLSTMKASSILTWVTATIGICKWKNRCICTWIKQNVEHVTGIRRELQWWLLELPLNENFFNFIPNAKMHGLRRLDTKRCAPKRGPKRSMWESCFTPYCHYQCIFWVWQKRIHAFI